jgi:hypothetical protein
MRSREVKRFLRPTVRSSVIKQKILRRDRLTCQACGAIGGDQSDLFPFAEVSLTVGYRSEPSRASRTRLSDLRAECSDCNEGLRQLPFPKVNRLELLDQIQRATTDDQRAILNLLHPRI